MLSFIYLEMGLLVLILTGFAGWRYVIPALPAIWNKRYQQPEQAHDHERHIPPWRAFFTALAASVGVGNLAGVGTAIHLGGPGALFWMWVSALAGLSFRMCSVWLGLRYQGNDPESPLYATPMAYIKPFVIGSWAWVPAALAVLLMVKGFLTANLIQSNSVAHALQDELGLSNLLVAVSMAGLVAFVIMGGMRKIVDYSVTITPWMMLLYVGASLFILLSDPTRTMSILDLVVDHAFTPYSAAGGVIGYGVLQSLQFGVSRGIFSHASGIGVAPFLHASNHYSDRDNAFLAAFVPMVDTLIICSMTGLVVLSIGNWTEDNGAFLTTSAFQSFYGDTGKILIIACLVVFSFTTVINWAYYAERCFQFLGGQNVFMFRWSFILVTFCGPFFPVKIIWSAADIIIGLVIILHLFPLLYVILLHRKAINNALQGNPIEKDYLSDYSKG